MAAPAPPRQSIAIAKPSQQARPGSSVPASASNAKGRSPTQPAPAVRAPASRLKVVIRRLAPGLTETEFYAALEGDWKPGGSKVAWASYRPGKISRDIAKPSRPSRAYLHLKREDDLTLLSSKVRETLFADAKSSSNDSALLGPPIVEFAPYGRVPSSKVRKDGRQGTIDQDPEFIDFLESLTNPVAKPAVKETNGEKEMKPDEKTVTPLIQFLRDKKASKGKETAAAAKATKHARQESKEAKAGQGDKKQIAKSRKEVGPLDKKPLSTTKLEKATKEAVRAANKQASTVEAKSTQPPPVTPASPTSSTATAAAPSQAPKPERRRERGSVSAAAKILQRDLGIAPTSGRRKRDGLAASSPSRPATAAPSNAASSPTSVDKATASSAPAAAQAPAVPAASPAPKPPTGPSASRGTPKPPFPRNQHPPPAPATSACSPTATQAFLKHANPSQGVTEPLLEAAFTAFGPVTKVEIDKKKGFAYVDFAAPEGLQKAVAASPVPVGQGSVVVLERKTGATLQNRNAKGGPIVRGGGSGISTGVGGGGGGGSAASGPPAPLGSSRGGRGSSGRGRGRPVGIPGRGAPAKGAPATATAAATAPTKPAVTSNTGPPQGATGSAASNTQAT